MEHEEAKTCHAERSQDENRIRKIQIPQCGRPVGRTNRSCTFVACFALTDFLSFTAAFVGVCACHGGIAFVFQHVGAKRVGSQGDFHKQLDIVEHFSKSVFRQNTPEDIVDIAASCIEQLGLEDCVIYLKDPRRQVWVQKPPTGPRMGLPRHPRAHRLGFGRALSAGRKRWQRSYDTSKDPDYVVDDAMRGSEMAVPILCDGEVIGVIDSEHTIGFFEPFT